MKILLKHTLSSIKKGFGQIIIMIITMIIITASIFVSLSVTDIFKKNADVWAEAHDAKCDLRFSSDAVDVPKIEEIVEANKEYIKDYHYASELEGTIKSDYDTTRIELMSTDAEKMLEMLETPIIREVENTTEYPSIIISRILSERLSIDVGDIINISSVSYEGIELRMFVNKIAENSTYLYRVGTYRAMAEYEEVIAYLGNDKLTYNNVRFYLYTPDALLPNDPDGRTIEKYVQDYIYGALNLSAPGAGAIIASEGDGQIEKSITENQNTLNVAIAVIVLMMVFILYFSYSIIAKNRGEIIIRFKAAGATPSQTVGIMLVEVIFYAVIACTIGVFAGRFINDAVASTMLYSKSTLLTYQPWQYLVSLFAGIFTGIIACLVPAYKISRKSIRQLMTGDMLISKRTPVFVPIIFTVLLAGCFVLLFSLPDYALYSMIALVLVGCFWVVTITPYILKLFSFIMGKITTRREGKLATLGLHRNSGIAAVTAMMSLMICFIWAGISIIGVISTVTREEFTQYNSDFTITNVGGLSTDEAKEEVDNLSSLDGLEAGAAYKTAGGFVSPGESEEEFRVEISYYHAVSSGEAMRYLTRDCDESVIDAFNNTAHPIIVSYSLSQRLGKKVGDTVVGFAWYYNVSYRLDGEFTIVGIDHYYTNYEDECYIRLDDLVSGDIDFRAVNTMFTFSGDDSKFTSLREKIDNDVRTIYRTRSYYVITEGSEDLSAIMDYVSYFVYFVSALGLINLITITSIERKKEMETFNLVGLTTGGTFKMTFVEGIIISLSGLIMGLTLAIAISNLQPIFCKLMGKYAIFDIFPTRMFIIAFVASIIGLLMWMISPIFATNVIGKKHTKTIHSAD